MEAESIKEGSQGHLCGGRGQEPLAPTASRKGVVRWVSKGVLGWWLVSSPLCRTVSLSYPKALGLRISVLRGEDLGGSIMGLLQTPSAALSEKMQLPFPCPCPLPQSNIQQLDQIFTFSDHIFVSCCKFELLMHHAPLEWAISKHLLYSVSSVHPYHPLGLAYLSGLDSQGPKPAVLEGGL